MRSATAIETQAKVDPGSSGPPRLDTRGRIVGIVVGSTTAVAGACYAVSVQHVDELLRP